MELRQLRYFLAVAEELHFGRAAERMHIVQSAVSQQVRRLERELGVDLFDRTTRTVRLTEAGHRFLPHAREVVAAEERALDAMRSVRAERDATLRLGTSDGLGERLDRLLAEYARRAPRSQLELVHASTEERLRRVRSGELDGAIVRGRWTWPGLRMIEVWTDEVLAALPAGLFAGADVALAELAGLPLRLSGRARNPRLYDLVVGACHEAGFEPVFGPEFTTAQDTLAAIAFGRGAWTVFYEPHASQLPIPGVEFRRLRPALRMPAFLAVAASRPAPKALIAAARG
ncbi:LysR family transcriptional regulator [Amycolatopsis deserti]|uniref:LysR family transcriptional regulator n=1 Tax=Amycolatopsis deserti TaxID=185696 RepID=A0ABQ3J816_9PSEU|nr:LysR family transcriptional regulator [Amycolatopsis deserti]GHF04013.1 LysR family transcriptional regulator [Amycolatopsis deserti]